MELEAIVERGRTGWLCLSKSRSEVQHAGNEGYDDVLGSYYSWDSTVQNHAAIQPGHLIAIWNGESLLGVSYVEHISINTDSKLIYKCPQCGLARIKKRRSLAPLYRCSNRDCKAEFDVPTTIQIEVIWYRADYEAGWVPMDIYVNADRCRELAKSPTSQLSIRQINWAKLEELLEELPRSYVVPLRARDEVLHGGHLMRTVRVRLGQEAFRRKLRERFGDTCAFTGPTHLATLEAAHLYSYAEIGTHHTNGGLLLRRDVHRLFDRGLLAVDPNPLVISAASGLFAYEEYRRLDGERLKVDLPSEAREWLDLHWKQFRGQ
jgi:predicted RNA-binding Zn-ribbon protein involved in translation (DUF1610 family)